MGYNPQESLQNMINTICALLGVQPTVSWLRSYYLSKVRKSLRRQHTSIPLSFVLLMPLKRDTVCTCLHSATVFFKQNPMKKGGLTSLSNLSRGLTCLTNQPSLLKQIQGSMVF